MPVTEAQWRQLYKLFNPRARLEASELDLYVQRPGAVARAVMEDLELEPEARWIVCGSFGCGKSSELLELGRLLWDSHAVVGLDVYQSTAQINEISAAEVLFLIGAAAIQAASEHWSQPVPRGSVERLQRAFQGVMGDQGLRVAPGDLLKGVALFTANLAAPGSTAVVGAATGAAQALASVLPPLKKSGGSPTVGGLTRPLRDGDADLETLIAAVNEVLGALSEIRPPVVLVDGLDKLTDLGTIRALFAATRSLARPACPVVYTAPITLMLSAEWQQTGGAFRRERLTNVVVEPPSVESAHLSEGRVEEGRAAMREVVARRAGRLKLTPEDIFEPDALKTLLGASGGLLRDLIHLCNRAIREALRTGAGRIGPEQVASAVEEIRKEYLVTFNTLRVDELRHVRKHGEPSGKPEGMELLLGSYVLPYANGTVWFEPHPILRGTRPGI